MIVNRQEVFRRRATTSVLATIAWVVAQNLAFVGVVAGFWHITWIAGVGMLAGGLGGGGGALGRLHAPGTRSGDLAWRQGLQNVGDNPTSEGSFWNAGTWAFANP